MAGETPAIVGNFHLPTRRDKVAALPQKRFYPILDLDCKSGVTETYYLGFPTLFDNTLEDEER